MDKKTLIIACLCLVSFTAFGSDVDSLQMLQDSITDLNLRLLNLEKIRDNSFFWLKVIGINLGITLSSLFGLYRFIMNAAKKYTIEKIESQTNEIVEKSLVEKLGGKLALAKSFFENLEKENDIKENPILIISSTTGRQKDLAQFLEEHGYHKLSFKSINELSATDSNDFKILFFYNQDGNLIERQMSKIVDDYKNNFDAFVYFGSNWSNDGFHKYKNVVTFTTNQSAIPTNLFDALRTNKNNLSA